LKALLPIGQSGENGGLRRYQAVGNRGSGSWPTDHEAVALGRHRQPNGVGFGEQG